MLATVLHRTHGYTGEMILGDGTALEFVNGQAGPTTITFADAQSLTVMGFSVVTGDTPSIGYDLFTDQLMAPVVTSTASNTSAALRAAFVSIVKPSGDATGATDAAKINAALTSGAQRVALAGGTFWVNTPILLQSNTWLQGSGEGVTEIHAAAGANCDVIQGAGFAGLTLTGAAPFASGVYNSSVTDLLIDGNAANQTTPGYGYRVYGYANAVRNVVVRNCLTGIWHEGGALAAQDGAGDPGSECEFTNIRIYLSQSHGMMLLGPSDPVLSNITIGFSNVSLAASGVGMWLLADQKSNIMATASAMNGVNASGFTGIFTVAAAQFGNPTDLYASTGTLKVTTSSGTAVMTYTGKTGTTFTGCTVTSGSGTFVTGNSVITNGVQKFTTNGALLSQVHPFGCGQTWGFVLDGTTTAVNCHSDGTLYGGVLARGSVSWHGGEIYDFTPITTALGVQLGDSGSTPGVPLTASVQTSACDIVTSIVGFNLDQANRAAVNGANYAQSRVSVKAVTQTTGNHTATLASGSNGVDLSTFTGGSPGTLFVSSTNQIPVTGGGTLTVATAKGTVTCTYTGTNGTNTLMSHNAGNQFTGVVATGTSGSGYTMSTGGAVTQPNLGTVGFGGTVDGSSRIELHVSSATVAAGTGASIEKARGAYSRDLGAASNGYRLLVNGTDLVNLNSSNKQLQLPNAVRQLFYSDNYSTNTLTLDGATGLITGPARNGKAPTFPSPAQGPGDQGLVTWTFDVALAASNSAVPTSGTVFLSRVHCPTVFTATNLVTYIITAGATLTVGQCFMGLYDSAGNLLGQTADLSSGATSFASQGSFNFPLTTPLTNLPAGDYYVGLLFNGTTGPALPRATNQSTNLLNMGTTAGSYRYCTANAGVTALPATLGTQTANAFAWYMAIN